MDVAAIWISSVGVALSAIVAGLALWTSRGARGLAKKADQRADDLLAAVVRQAVAAEHMAAAAGVVGQQPATRPEVEWVINAVPGLHYLLRNIGTGTATDVHLLDSTDVRNWGVPRTVPPKGGGEFWLFADVVAERVGPTHLTIACNELGITAVPIPPGVR